MMVPHQTWMWELTIWHACSEVGRKIIRRILLFPLHKKKPCLDRQLHPETVSGEGGDKRRRRRRRSLEPTWPPLWVSLSWITPPPLSHININKPTSMTESAFCGRVSLMETQSDVLITGKTDKVSEPTYFNCWQSISTGVLGIAESL